jgi:hypothetical protein
MKKILISFAIITMVILAVGVVAETVSISEDSQKIVNNILKERGLDETEVQSIEKVNLSDLPEQINIENIDNTNVAMYQVDMGTEKPVYVITISDETVKGFKKDRIILTKMLINFGLKEKATESQFLESAVGVKGSLEKGYVMMRDGSITGLSTNAEILDGNGDIEIIVYRNQKEVGFRNNIVADSNGVKNDYDTQSADTITFEAGDVVSIYVKVNGDVKFQDINTLIEISTNE